jgi:glycerol-3-phosphate dehydrogenase
VAKLRAPDGERTVRARALVNAAGPWAAELRDRLHGGGRGRKTRLVKGSHIVIPRLYAGEHAFLLQNRDGRVVFAIPFEENFTLVGTTDVECDGAAGDPAISREEIEYLLATIHRYFETALSADEIVWSYSGIRALVDDGSSSLSKLSRDYALELDADGPPLLTVLGGKITTYRHLAQQALGKLARFFSRMGGPWTAGATLPGGKIPDLNLERYSAHLRRARKGLPPDLLDRLARTYGSRAERLLDGVRSVGDLGQHFGAGLYAREVDYLVANEWARTAEDILFRRTKLGLHISLEAAARLRAYLDAL